MVSTAELRLAVAGLTDLAARDLGTAWADPTDAAAARAALGDLLGPLLDAYGAAAAAIAADWYDDLRDAESDARSRFRAIPAAPVTGGIDVLAGVAVGPLFGANPDTAAAVTLAVGGLQRLIANAARDTVTGSAVADPAAEGWQRVAYGGCGFCRMLAGRGAVYTEGRADFASHDHCHCHATPAWKGKPVPVKPYTPSAADITDADRARVRRWIADNGL